MDKGADVNAQGAAFDIALYGALIKSHPDTANF